MNYAAFPFIAAPIIWACLWDYDTLLMERERFPETLELITGKFLRHSAEFYDWRVRDRLERLKSDPANLAWLDDLAVAYDKTGRHAEAIETMRRAEALQPRRYETLANLGTFYLHSGRLAQGVEVIAKAIDVNPKAHFGREIYQKLLAEYLLSKSPEGKPGLPLDPDERRRMVGVPGFAGFVAERRSQEQGEFLAAQKGVLGMMKFGNFEHPILLEALGDLLLPARRLDAKLLAARAYLKASYGTTVAPARAAYRKLAEAALMMQTPDGSEHRSVSLAEVESAFEQELDDARAWYLGLHGDELEWIRGGKDVDAEFTRKYYRAPAVIDTSPFWGEKQAWIVRLAILLAVLAWLRSFLNRRRRRRLAEGN